jgi:uncharacterized membrane protein YdjX (TVP38/TMEM64 family)
MKKNKIDMLKILLLAIFIIGLILLTLTFGRDLTLLLKDPKKFEEWIHSFGTLGILVFIAVQIIQVVIFIIPGEVVQVAGGYLYGTLMGSIYSVIGITIGSLICFLIAKFLGYDFVRSIISEEKLKKFNYVINNPKGEFILFLLFFIPGLPKDALSYISGLTPVKFYNFFLITLFARLPGIVFSACIGANFQSKNYLLAGSISVIALMLFVIGILNKDKIMKKLNRIDKSR